MPKKKTEAADPTETPEEAAKRIPSKDEPEILEDGFPNPAANKAAHITFRRTQIDPQGGCYGLRFHRRTSVDQSLAVLFYGDVIKEPQKLPNGRPQTLPMLKHPVPDRDWE